MLLYLLSFEERFDIRDIMGKVTELLCWRAFCEIDTI